MVKNGKRQKKFREFLADHSDFRTIQSEDSEVQRIVKILDDPSHTSYADISRHYVLDDGLLYRITDPSKCVFLWFTAGHP